MGTLSFQIVDATDGTVTKSYTNFSDADITRWIAAYQARADAARGSSSTRLQVLNFIISSFVAEQIATVRAYETAEAEKTAQAATPISIT